MLIPEISQVGGRTSGRREPSANPRRALTAVAPRASVEPAGVEAGEDIEADDLAAAAPQQGMTLAGAQAAYASY